MAPRPRSTLATAAVIVLLVAPAAGCALNARPGEPTTPRAAYPAPDPPATLSVPAAREVAVEAEAARLADRFAGRQDVRSVRIDPGAVDPRTSAHRIGDAVYVSVAYPYGVTRIAGGFDAVSRTGYLVTTDAVRRIDHDERTRRATTFAGGRTVADPVPLRVIDVANGSRPVDVSLTYLDEPATAFAGAIASGPQGTTVRAVASRVGTYRVTATRNGTIATTTTRIGPDATGPIVVLARANGSLSVFRVADLR
ncbi:MAG: hypothetical protein ABEJ76_01510 [Halanaeroarchaeum sp.]